MHPPILASMSIHSGDFDAVPCWQKKKRVWFSLLFLSLFLYSVMAMRNLIWLSIWHFSTFVQLQKNAKAFYSSRSSTFLSTVSEWVETGILTQAYRPFLYWTQEGPLRLNSFSWPCVGNGAQFLSAFQSLNYLGCPLYLFYNIYTLLSFYQFFFLVWVSKFKSQIWLLYISLPFFHNIPTIKERVS